MRKWNVCVLFGGMSREHEVSLRSAEAVLNNLDPEKYNIYPVGITRDGRWYHYVGSDYEKIATGDWEEAEENCPVAISPVRGQGLLCFEEGCVTTVALDVVFPMLHGKNGEDGAIQGLLQLAGIACVGADLETAALAMDRDLTKQVACRMGLTHGDWMVIRSEELHRRMEAVIARIQENFLFPVYVKPVGTGSSVGVSKATDGISLQVALLTAAEQDERVLIEEAVRGKEVKVAVMGNSSPIASICGQIDYETAISEDGDSVVKTPVQIIPADIEEDVAEQIRDCAVKMYSAMGCRGLSRVDFFVTEDGQPVFHKISTMPCFEINAMYPKLFAASGVEFSDLLDRLLELAMEAEQ